ncbi:MAG: hypothetical protein WC433_06510 [Candidatus Omnitrophota bacterium]
MSEFKEPEVSDIDGSEKPKGSVGRLIDKLEVIEANIPKMKVRWWNKAWAWMDRKKTIAGLGMVLLGGIGSLIPGIQIAGQAAFYTGCALAGIGLFHKAAKEQTVIGDKGTFGIVEIIELAILILTTVAAYFKTQKKE